MTKPGLGEKVRTSMKGSSDQPQLSGPVQGFIENPHIDDPLEGRAVAGAKRSSLQLEGMQPSSEFVQEFADSKLSMPKPPTPVGQKPARGRMPSGQVGVLMVMGAVCLALVGLLLDTLGGFGITGMVVALAMPIGYVAMLMGVVGVTEGQSRGWGVVSIVVGAIAAYWLILGVAGMQIFNSLLSIGGVLL